MFNSNAVFSVLEAKFGGTGFVSVGIYKIEDISKAVQIFKKDRTPITLIHTVSVNSLKIVSLNLLSRLTTKDKFKGWIDQSGHETSTSLTSIECAPNLLQYKCIQILIGKCMEVTS